MHYSKPIFFVVMIASASSVMGNWCRGGKSYCGGTLLSSKYLYGRKTLAAMIAEATGDKPEDITDEEIGKSLFYCHDSTYELEFEDICGEGCGLNDDRSDAECKYPDDALLYATSYCERGTPGTRYCGRTLLDAKHEFRKLDLARSISRDIGVYPEDIPDEVVNNSLFTCLNPFNVNYHSYCKYGCQNVDSSDAGVCKQQGDAETILSSNEQNSLRNTIDL